MKNTLKTKKKDQIDKIIDLSLKDKSKAHSKDMPIFIRHMFEHIALEDLNFASPEKLGYLASHFWDFFQKRKSSEIRVNIYTCQIGSAAAQGHKTIIEVLTNDMPFLVDSVTAEITSSGFQTNLFLHPVLSTLRDRAGHFMGLPQAVDTSDNKIQTEALMLLELNQLLSPEQTEALQQRLVKTLEAVAASVADWQMMRKKLYSVINEMTFVPGLKIEEEEEARAFLHWLDQDHFTFLAGREFNYVSKDKKAGRELIAESQLGLFSNKAFEKAHQEFESKTELESFLKGTQLVRAAKSLMVSPVHRPTFMDIIRVKKFSQTGEVIGDYEFLGLFTSTAYHDKPEQIPLCRQKVKYVLEKSGFHPKSHDGKALIHILNTFPRDELFQIAENTLHEISMGILELFERPEVCLFVRVDTHGHAISCFVFVPRDRYDTRLREKILKILEESFKGKTAAFYTHISDENLARLHVIIRSENQIPEFNLDEINDRLSIAAESWEDHLRSLLLDKKSEETAWSLLNQFNHAFPIAYQERYSPDDAIIDIEILVSVIQRQRLGVNLYAYPYDDQRLLLKLYHIGKPIHLSDVMPMLEGMGLRAVSEVPFEIRVQDVPESLWLHEFLLETKHNVNIKFIKEKFETAFSQLWLGHIENDHLNGLVLTAGLTWREILILRGYTRYLRQIGSLFSHNYVEFCLARYPLFAKTLIEIFLLKFDPKIERPNDEALAEKEASLKEQLEAITNIDDDRILRRFLNLIKSTLRVNFFQKDAMGKDKTYFSLKFDSLQINDLPLPRPQFEIFVYAPEMEAIHLRGGKVARGGLRWSDRREDFRTEVLGLMKAQMIKNALIVPVGSKGGFVVKSEDKPSREKVVECYKTMIRGLLDLTDNLKGDEVIPPQDVVRHDEDDTYLVVAADKGTATFSDIANEISKEYGFWLQDAFASGGSSGYDHKKMGITARGAWESVKRHFREMGKDIEAETFTVLGVGDMAGDVFGNGMLLSENIRLQAAFNHQAIFIDPNPNAAESFLERKRLFELPYSTWSDYDKKLISQGGGVFLRDQKSIPLSPEIQQMLGTEESALAPSDLIKMLLTMHVELIWFGGIGTFIKSKLENNATVGDRANDQLRVDGKEINAKIIGEGANLGLTQLGRIEFAQKGGRVNTDSIDNAGGVNCSDHEVNIKILLNDLIDRGELTLEDRDKLLVEMTGEVAALVIQDNYTQNQALSVAEAQGYDHANHYSRLINYLEKKGILNSALENLPDDEKMKERKAHKKGLLRPELSVLLAHSKITLGREIAKSNFADDPALLQDLMNYFPKQLQDKWGHAIPRHRLRREITATVVTNNLINRAGLAFVHEQMRKTGANASDITKSYIITRRIFDLENVWQRIETLDTNVNVEMQLHLTKRVERLLERVSLWLLHYCTHPLQIDENIEFFAPGIELLSQKFEDALDDVDRQHLQDRVDSFTIENVPQDLAKTIANMSFLNSACDIIRISHYAKRDVLEAAQLFFAVGKRFNLNWLRQVAREIDAQNQWEKISVSSLIEQIYIHQSSMTLDMFMHDESSPADILESWLERHADIVVPFDEIIRELKAQGVVDIPMLLVVNNQLKGLMPLE